jgi:hypothetical protein
MVYPGGDRYELARKNDDEFLLGKRLLLSRWLLSKAT